MNTDTNNSRKGSVTDDQFQTDELFDRVVSILEQARTNVVRSIDNQMVIAYWLIGREIVESAQGGDERAKYGKKVMERLSVRLTQRYGEGFSMTNLRYIRLFYQTYSERMPEIRHMACDESDRLDGISQNHHTACDVLENMNLAVEKNECIQGFSPLLSWSHYRTLTRVENKNDFIQLFDAFRENKLSIPHWDFTSFNPELLLGFENLATRT